MTLDDIKNSSNDEQILTKAQQYIKEKYRWLSDYESMIQLNEYNYGNGQEYSAKVRYGYKWTYPHTSTIKESVIMAIECFEDERENCRKFLDDIDDDFD